MNRLATNKIIYFLKSRPTKAGTKSLAFNFDAKRLEVVGGFTNGSEKSLTHLEGSGTSEARFSSHDSGRRRIKGVDFSGQGCRSQEPDGRLEGHLLQRTRIVLDSDPGKTSIV